MSDAAKELIGYLMMLGVLLGILRLTLTKTPRRNNVVSIRKDRGGDAA